MSNSTMNMFKVGDIVKHKKISNMLLEIVHIDEYTIRVQYETPTGIAIAHSLDENLIMVKPKRIEKFEGYEQFYNEHT